MSAVERLFGSGNSTPSSAPVKKGGQSSTSSPLISAFQSPIARRIAEEVEKASHGKKETKVEETTTVRAPPPIPPRTNPASVAPDVVKSTIHNSKISESTIDNLFGAPDKIHIPERYIPEAVSSNNTPEHLEQT